MTDTQRSVIKIYSEGLEFLERDKIDFASSGIDIAKDEQEFADLAILYVDYTKVKDLERASHFFDNNRTPFIMVTLGSSFRDEIEAARNGACAFLKLPLSNKEIIEVVKQNIGQGELNTAKVLIVDDDTIMLEFLELLLEDEGYDVATTTNPWEFMNKLEDEDPDLVILDYNMPDINGLDLCRAAKNHSVWKTIPILFLSSSNDRETITKMYAAGADDYIGKPVVMPELLTRIRNRLEKDFLYRRLTEIDPLTGVSNRRRSEEIIQRYILLSKRHKQPLCLAVLDIDNFKGINDSYGHAMGDDVLARFAHILSSSFRQEDEVGRWGGEEFVVGMYGISAEKAKERLEQVLTKVKMCTFKSSEGVEFKVSFSAGIAESTEEMNELPVMYKGADEALYVAKKLGKSRVEIYSRPF